ncbi:hypothetical protein IFM89_030355 [Coptis chinensis]|uniref:Uncharacterized protein n=1 Tax=Coptis chinensis TaxID=261450 RepID=A0A835IJ22_9MAGN|nr:hypothetical protein IFM89_030355 [Coptis chinensis]
MTNHGLASSIAQAIPSQGWQSQPVQAYCLSRDVNEGSKISINEIDKTPITRDGNTTSIEVNATVCQMPTTQSSFSFGALQDTVFNLRLCKMSPVFRNMACCRGLKHRQRRVFYSNMNPFVSFGVNRYLAMMYTALVIMNKFDIFAFP